MKCRVASCFAPHVRAQTFFKVKKTTRMASKINEYEREKGEGRYPYCAFIGDSLRASVVCEDAEAFWRGLSVVLQRYVASQLLSALVSRT